MVEPTDAGTSWKFLTYLNLTSNGGQYRILVKTNLFYEETTNFVTTFEKKNTVEALRLWTSRQMLSIPIILLNLLSVGTLWIYRILVANSFDGMFRDFTIKTGRLSANQVRNKKKKTEFQWKLQYQVRKAEITRPKFKDFFRKPHFL